MNQREKLLLWITTAGVAITVVYFGFQGVLGKFNGLSTSILNVEQDIESKETTKNRMNNDLAYLAESVTRSLSSDPDRAQTRYTAWISALADKPADPDRRSSAPLLDDFTVVPGRHAVVPDSHVRLSFRIVGTTDLKRVTRFLHAFYSAPILHRIQDIVLTPETGKNLRVTATVEALGMLDAELQPAIGSDPTTDVLVHDSLDTYLDGILERNLFGPPNKLPTFRGNSLIELDTGSNEKVTISADASESDQKIVSIEILKTDLPQMPELDIGTNSASFELQSDEEVEYTMTVLVADSGFPKKVAKREYTIRFSDPPPPTVPTVQEDFDAAKLAFFSATVQINDLLEAWIVRRETGTLLKLHIGDEIEVGTLYGVVDRISFKELEIDTPDGFLLIKRGQSLADAVNLTAAAEALLDDGDDASSEEDDDLR